MYPHSLFLGIDLYTVSICIGIIACFFVFGKLSDKVKLGAKLHNMILIAGAAGIGAGYGSAVVFQAFYNIASRGRFELDSETGATFYGGLIGGAVFFLAIYFIAGHFLFKDRIHLTKFFTMAACVAPPIAVAHGFGRIGCLMAGCCHGSTTDAWYGILMHGNMGYQKYVPVQLFEAIFLFALCGVLCYRAVKGKQGNFSLYLIAYGVWRFFIEYARSDYRGTTFVSFLTPSQLTSVILVLAGAALLIAEIVICRKTASEEKALD